LRVEAGLCLYGADLDTTTTPVEADLVWSINASRRAGGARQGGFPGSDVILRQLASGAQRHRVGLQGQSRVPIRAGSRLFANEQDDTVIGHVTSGVFSPSLGCPVAFGYVPPAMASTGNVLVAEVRERRLRVRVSELPFVPHRYKRNGSRGTVDVEIHKRP
jgi:aminomethyltransferase